MGLVKLIKAITNGRRSHRQVRTQRAERDLRADPDDGFASIYSAEYADKLLKTNQQGNLNAKPVGSPFQLKSYTKDPVIRYDVNSAYWGPKPKINRLIYAITPDATVRAQKIKGANARSRCRPSRRT